jgi:hypothetical protein
MRRLQLSRVLCLVVLAACGDVRNGESSGSEPTSSNVAPLAQANMALTVDRDGDGVTDPSDNCPDVPNADQADRNQIGVGDACELSLTWSRGLLTHYARYQSHKELVVWFSPLLLTGAPDLMRVSAPGKDAFAHLSLVTRRLGVRSGREILPGQADTISGAEVLRVQLGEDKVLGAAKASRVWLRVEGSATVAVNFFAGSEALGARSQSTTGVSWLSFEAPAGAAFDRIELRAESGSFALRGQSDGIVFALSKGLAPCAAGYERVGQSCVDIDECAGLTRVCDPLSTCANLPGSFACGACPTGYRGTGATSCEDIDECAEDASVCSPLSTCSNTSGGYQCSACPAGYAGDGHVCTDIDECANGTHGCDPLVLCNNRAGGYDCGSCPSGYAGGGHTGCVDIDECAGDNRACDSLTSCTNEPGGYRCGACPDGYRGTGDSACVDIDECAEGTHECSPLVACANTAGGYQCGACPAGFSGDGRVCDDVDECALGTAQCSALVSCENSVGGYRCGACPNGYSGDGFVCRDVDECQEKPCDPRTSCTNQEGSYTCSACPDGFTGNGHAGCVDVDECAAGLDACSPLVTCANTTGSYTCAPCPAGFRGDGYTCTDIDECSEESDECSAVSECTNTPGSYLCGACPAGYTGDGRSCVDVDECLGTPCDPLSTCGNQPGSYTCSACPSGYTGDGYAGCVDIDECAQNNGGCPETEGCENRPGSMRCVPCPDGSVGLVTDCGVGACAAHGVTRCERGVVVDSCRAGLPSASDASCDNRDDDCDGSADEDFIVESSACGQGVCARTGTLSCVAGQLVNSCVPGAPSASLDRLCDGADEDCDGATDEEFSGACSASSADVCVDGRVVQAATCRDSLICNGSESCVAGLCVHSGPALDDGNPCTLDACSESTGITHVDRPFGSSCSDGDDCNGRELCLPCRESDNLLLNPSFERVWANVATGQGLLPMDWWAITSSPDTFSFDNSWGLGRAEYGHFTNVSSVPDGVRWVGAFSGTPERVAQELREPLVAGQRYRVSAQILSGVVYAQPGGYDVYLASDYSNAPARPNDVLIGFMGPAVQSNWTQMSLEFTAPSDAAERRLLVFSPRPITSGQAAYLAIDAVKLVRACAQSGARSCQRQDAPRIDDGQVCTVDSCSAAGGVAHTPRPSGSACNGNGTCDASGACSNRAPVFNNVPASYFFANTGSYRHQVNATDPDGDAIVFSRGASSTCSWTITSAGLVSLTGNPGATCVVAVQATDSRGAVSTQTRLVQTINAAASAPLVSSQPDQHAVFLGEQFAYRPRVWSSDPSVASTVSVSAGPAGMSVDAMGVVRWTPESSDLGSHEVRLQIVTPQGSVAQTFVVSVLAL